MQPFITVLVLTHVLILGPVAVAVRGKIGEGAAYLWGALFGVLGIIIVLLLSIRAELAPQSAPAASPAPAPDQSDLQTLADAQTPVGQL